MFEYGVEKHGERQKDVDMFWECVADAKNENKETGSKKIESFMEYKKKVLIH